ncbi:ABC transporter ATP-binding protein [Streptomyces sp. NPDC059917]|uniref:ABC transporter ATP-binding protein n=1 Tax=Streptomyces sp. NPDC059917 TaxID=3347002 RepID=UPI0036488C06
MTRAHTAPPAALEASDLAMSYGHGRRAKSVLDGLSFRLPQGVVCALVGPNGAGKSTLLSLAAGLLRPTSGTLRVLGETPAATRSRVAYVAQGKPLHPHLTVEATLRLGRDLNQGGHWDTAAAERIVYAGDAGGGLDPKARIRSLSGGQRSRVALALAFGKRPELMLLDEPMADLDPLARQQLTGVLMSEALEHGTTIVMSSHVVAELEDSCDHLLLTAGGRVLLCGGIEDIVDAHALVTGTGDLTGADVIEERPTGRGRTALVRPRGPLDTDADRAVERPSLQEVLLAHLRNPGAPALITDDAHPAPSARQEITA